MKSSFRGILAAGGMAVSAALVLTGCGQSDEISGGDLERVGSSIARGEAVVTVPTLSQRIVEDRGDLRLVDLRPVIEFEDGHIPGAMSAGVTEVIRADRAREMAGNRDLVLYSGDGVAAGQAAALLQLQGVNVVSLQGGFEAWDAWTRDPSLELPGQEPQLSSAERQAMTDFFHGDEAAPATRDERAAAMGLRPAARDDAPEAPAVDDPLGLGLQFGLGVGIDFELPVAGEVAEAPEEEPAPRRRLLIGEGC